MLPLLLKDFSKSELLRVLSAYITSGAIITETARYGKQKL